MLKLRHFTISWKILAHFEFDSSNTSQKSWNGDVKAVCSHQTCYIVLMISWIVLLFFIFTQDGN